MFFTVTCGEVRDWGGTVSFKAKFASAWIEWSSINSPFNWLLAEWLLLMLSIPYHNLLHTYRHNGDSRFEKSTYTVGGPNWSDLSPTCLSALLKSWNSLTTYAYVQNAYSDPMENADHQYDRQLRRTSLQSKSTTARSAADYWCVTARTNSLHPPPPKIKSNRRFNALAEYKHVRVEARRWRHM